MAKRIEVTFTEDMREEHLEKIIRTLLVSDALVTKVERLPEQTGVFNGDAMVARLNELGGSMGTPEFESMRKRAIHLCCELLNLLPPEYIERTINLIVLATGVDRVKAEVADAATPKEGKDEWPNTIDE